MNQAASKELCKMEDFYRQKGVGQGSHTSKTKQIGCGKATFLQGTAQVHLANDLSNAGQVIPDWRFKIPFLGEADTVIKLSLCLVTWGLV